MDRDGKAELYLIYYYIGSNQFLGRSRQAREGWGQMGKTRWADWWITDCHGRIGGPPLTLGGCGALGGRAFKPVCTGGSGRGWPVNVGDQLPWLRGTGLEAT